MTLPLRVPSNLRRPRRVMYGLVVFALALAAITPARAASEEGTKPLKIGVYGGGDAVWAFRRDASPATGGDLLRFCYQVTGGTNPQRYWPGPVVVGDVAVAVTNGTGLHAFFRDGTHRHYLPDPRIMRTGPPFTDLGEANTPGEKPPIAACWDEGASCMVAVLTAAQVAAITPSVPLDGTDVEKDATSATSDAAEQDPAAPDSITAAPPNITTPFALVRYASRRWTVDRSTPPDLHDDGVVIGILANKGMVHLFYADRKDWRTLRQSALQAGSDTWSAPTTLALPEHAEPMVVGWQVDRPVLLYREAARVGVTIGSISLAEGVWKTGPVLAKNAAEAQTFDTPVVAAFAGSAVAVAVTDAVGDVRIGTWSVETGAVLHAPAIAPPLAPSLFPKVDPATQHLLQYAILLAALAAVFVWRRDNMMALVPIGVHNRYARFQHRFLALTLDLVILAPAWGLLLYRLIDQSDEGITLTEQLMQNHGTLPPAWYWSWGIIGVVFALYGTIFEHLLGATPGKRILGCRVVAENGERCSLKCILIRNAIRPIEFHFTAIAFLVFLTPSRQRLGDILAGAVVVERADSDGESKGESDAAVVDVDAADDPYDDPDDDSDHTDFVV